MKWIWFLVCFMAGLALLACGLLIPAHLRAVDAGVIQIAGRSTSSLSEQIKALAQKGDLGTAQMLVQAAVAAQIPDGELLGTTVTNLVRQNPGALFWGNASKVEDLFGGKLNPAQPNTESFTAFMVRQKNREAALAHLHDSPNPAVQELLRSRSLNNTVLFPSPQSAAGQVYDTAVALSGLLVDSGSLSASLKQNVSALAAAANDGDNSEPLEQVLMDLMSLGQRFNWDQLTAFLAQIQSPATLHQLTDQVRNVNTELPVLFAAVQLSAQPEAVTKYVTNFKQTGFPDLTASLRYGAGGVQQMVKQQQRFYNPGWERSLTILNPFGPLFYSAANFSIQQPIYALAVKWLAYLLAGFFLAAALHHARPSVSPLQQPLQVRGIHWLRELLFSAGFLLLVLLLSEPFLSQESQKGDFSLRPHLPMAGGVVSAGIVGIKQNIMNPTIILTLLIFFVLQALLYFGCLVKLAEIRRQNVPARMKLKLLENEDHLFDAGLYLGFVGTIVSLIVASMGLVKFSLMAAYSSTSFGIIFVVIFKIFHLRPARRELLLEVEAETPSAEVPLRVSAPLVPLPS
ncbi:MAG: hypothetical protein ABSE48_07965 [Verrucomicrobiota bacterium]